MEPKVASKFMAFDDYKPNFPSSSKALNPARNATIANGVASNDLDKKFTSRHAPMLALTGSDEGQSGSPDHDVKVTGVKGKVTGRLAKVGAVALGIAALAGVALAYRKFA